MKTRNYENSDLFKNVEEQLKNKNKRDRKIDDIFINFITIDNKKFNDYVQLAEYLNISYTSLRSLLLNFFKHLIKINNIKGNIPSTKLLNNFRNLNCVGEKNSYHQSKNKKIQQNDEKS